MTCAICNDQCNLNGIARADSEVIPFVKELLQVRYPKHPFPVRFGMLAESCLAFAQVVEHVRGSALIATYHTENKYLLNFAEQLHERFGVWVKPSSEAPAGVLNACQYNLEK